MRNGARANARTGRVDFVRIERQSESRKFSEGETIFLAIGWLSIIAATCVVYFNLPIVCTFKASIGWPCPACGSTRSLMALGRGDLWTSFRMNPLAAATYLALLMLTLQMVAGRFIRSLRFRVVLEESEWPGFVAVLAVLLIASWAFLIADGR